MTPGDKNESDVGCKMGSMFCHVDNAKGGWGVTWKKHIIYPLGTLRGRTGLRVNGSLDRHGTGRGIMVKP